jgi:CRP-like cAMP-binding protein
VLSRPHFQNKLFSLVPSAELDVLLRSLEAIDLPKGFVIAKIKAPIEYVYFPETGLGSIVSVSPLGEKAEAGMFGYEGFGPTPPAADSSRSYHEVVIQSEGHGHRMSVAALWAAMDLCPNFAKLLTRSSHNLATQVSYTALCNAVHHIDQRLTRWLLMSHDRLREDELRITHEYLSLMLAVRRTSVTDALHILEGKHFIRAERGKVTIRDRTAMEAFARDLYGRPEAEYVDLFGITFGQVDRTHAVPSVKAQEAAESR